MTRRPSFPLYHGDFVAATQLMTLAARGAHTTLLCTSWELGPIPDKRTALYKAMALGPDDVFDNIWAEVRPQWTLTDAGWINERLERSRDERDRFVEQQRWKGKRGGRPRKHDEESRGFHPEMPTEESRGFHPENAARTAETATKKAAGDIARKAETKPWLNPKTPPEEKPEESLPSPSPSPFEDQEQPASPDLSDAEEKPNPDDPVPPVSHRVYKAIAYRAIEEALRAGMDDIGVMTENAKCVCAEQGLLYNPEGVRKGIDAALKTLAKKAKRYPRVAKPGQGRAHA